RTLSSVVWSCLVTIFACTWVSVHHNVVPASESGIDSAALLDRVGIAALTMLVPEYTLAWVVRQWIVAREIAKEFNKLSVLPPHAGVDSGVETTVGHDMGINAHEEKMTTADRKGPATESAAINLRGFGTGLAELWTSLLSRFSNGEEHPVSREDLEDIIKTRPFEPPAKQDIDARSNSDAFSKTGTALQTLWFIMQCIARVIHHLPIMNIEITTLAYTAINFAMHRAWFHKPLNISLPIPLIKIAKPENSSPPTTIKVGWREQIKTFVKAMEGTQDDEVNLSELRRAPTLYAGRPEEHQVIIANAIALAVGVIFGVIHYIAWSFAFPSPAEKLLWRISALTTAAVPTFYVV
ncbi:hypothetical protein FIBSPDRAFT_665139, partial [Athelia psychrophila]